TWQLSGIFSARSGLPMVVGQRVGSYQQRPDATGLDPYAQDSSRTLFAQYLSRAAFVPVPTSPRSGEPIRPGSLGNNALWGIASWNLDLGMGKNFYVTERIRLQVRLDMFNLFNHPTYDGVSTNILAGNFGQIVSARGGRVGQLAGRLSW